jgi:hypothetical protein
MGVPTTKNPENSDCVILQVSWKGLRALCTIHRKFGSSAVWQCAENAMVPHHAWTTYFVADEETHVLWVQANHSPKPIVNCTCYFVRQDNLSQRIDHVYCPSRHWLAHISAGFDFWAYVDWGFLTYLSEYYTPLKTVILFNTPCNVLRGFVFLNCSHGSQ